MTDFDSSARERAGPRTPRMRETCPCRTPCPRRPEGTAHRGLPTDPRSLVLLPGSRSGLPT